MKQGTGWLDGYYEVVAITERGSGESMGVLERRLQKSWREGYLSAVGQGGMVRKLEGNSMWPDCSIALW